MTAIDDPTRSATDLADVIARRELSPLEVMEDTLRRVEEREPSLNALVFRGFDEAMESARLAGEFLSRWEESRPLTGVLVVMNGQPAPGLREPRVPDTAERCLEPWVR